MQYQWLRDGASAARAAIAALQAEDAGHKISVRRATPTAATTPENLTSAETSGVAVNAAAATAGNHPEYGDDCEIARGQRDAHRHGGR